MTDGRSLIQRLRAELDLERQSNADLNLFATLFTSIDVGVAIWHAPAARPGGVDLVASNAAADSLLEDEDRAAPQVTGDYPIFDPNSLLERLPEVLEAQAPVDLGEFTTPSGKRVYSVRATPLPDRHVGAILFDLTERKRFEEERRALEGRMQHGQKLESLGVLAGGIAHDFNNLLVGILGNVSLALLDLPASSSARPVVEQIEVAARRASELTRQMLAYSGKGRFVIESVDLSSLVEEMAHLLEVSITKRAVLRFEFDRGLPPIEADASQVRQVVMNLITNASDAVAATGGVIAISTGTVHADRAFLEDVFLLEPLPEGEYVYVQVTDTGVGMDAATQARVFDPFFTTKTTGRGLGMAAVLGIVRGHHGAIQVRSTPGRGSRLKVLFPAAEPRTASSDHAPVRRAPGRQHARVLVVDDQQTVRDVARRVLEREGFEVVLAADGGAAMEAFVADRDGIDCVLLDMSLPVLSGEEVLQELQLLRQDLPVVLTSGYSEQDATSRMSGKRLSAFLQKPWTAGELLAAIRGALGAD